MSSSGIATIVLVSANGTDPDSTVYARSWEIPNGHAEPFAQMMTERFGQPITEGVTSLANLDVATDRAGRRRRHHHRSLTARTPTAPHRSQRMLGEKI